MTNVIDSIPEQHRSTFVQVLEERDHALLEELRTQGTPTSEQAVTLTKVFGRAFIANLDEDDAPTERGVQIDDALAAFLTRWPREELEEA